MLRIFWILVCGFIFSSELQAQANECASLLDRAKKSHTKGDYADAFTKYRAVKLCAPDKAAEVDKLIEKLFADVNNERQRADDARVEAENALSTNRRIIDNIFFYAGKFGLAYNAGKFGFIDKEGNTMINFDYVGARPFNELGFAWAAQQGIGREQKFWVDTAGKNYHLAENLNELTSHTQVLDLSGITLDSLPDSVFNYTNLEMILLKKTEYIPSGMGKLHRLKLFSCEECTMDSLQADITDCVAMTHLLLHNSYLITLPNDIHNLKNLEVLNVSKAKRLTNLPSTIGQLSKLWELNLSSSSELQKLPPSFSQLVSLERLNLPYAGIKPTDLIVIKNFKRLTFLNLSENELGELPDDFFDSLKSLRILNLSYTDLIKFPKISQLKYLQSFDISYNKIQTMEIDFAKHPYLEVLNLDDLKQLESCELKGTPLSLISFTIFSNQLQELPQAIVYAPNLEELSIRGLQMTKMPNLASLRNLHKLSLFELSKLVDADNLKKCKNLRELEIYACFALFETNVNFLGSLENLQKLDLMGNKIKKLPSNIGNLKRLTRADFSINELTALPETFTVNCKKLKHLDLSSNKLLELPTNLSGFGKLDYLQLENNQLQTLPNSIDKLVNLSFLQLSQNQLQQLPQSIGSLGTLEYLNIDENKLDSLPSNIVNLKNLRTLFCGKNPVKKLPLEFQKLTNLEFLSLSNNPNLVEIPAEITKNLRNLTLLAVYDCGLKDFPSVAELKRLKTLNLSGNNFPADVKARIKSEVKSCVPNF